MRAVKLLGGAACFLAVFLGGARAQPAAEEAAAQTRALPLLVPKDGLDAIGASLGNLADAIGQAFPALDLERPIFLGISVARLALTLVVLALLSVAALLFLRWVGRKTDYTKYSSLPSALLEAAGKPLLWIALSFGFYLAFAPSLSGISAVESRELAAAILSRLTDITALAGWFWLILRVAGAVQRQMSQWAARAENEWRRLLAEIVGQVLRVSAPLLTIILLAPLLDLPPGLQLLVQKGVGLGLIAGVTGLIIRSTLLFQKALLAHYRLDVADNLEARKVFTQVSVLTKVIVSIVAILGVGCMLMVFDVVRQLGTSILASAGIAGIILGLAAQRTLGNLFAGIQIAISQPIRLDDVVIVEGEWGRIEEISLTYVVVRIWDLRRLVVPITYFVENPFQNWTRRESRLLGAVFVYVDYTAPLDHIREELKRIVEGSDRWDRQVSVLQVTDAKDNVIEVRCLVSAADAGQLFDLRCEVREKIITFLQRECPESLPKVRAEFREPGSAKEPSPADAPREEGSTLVVG